MKKNNYFINFISVLFWPIIFIIGQFLIKYIFVSVFNYSIKSDMTSYEFMDYMSTFEYSYRLETFINNYTVLMMMLLFMLFIVLMMRKYKKYKKVSSKFNVFIPILFGISISLIFNISIFNLNNLVYITDIFTKSSMPILSQAICTGILGPILEELLFRGIVYNKLKEFNSPMRAIILTSLLFGFFHFNLINMIYGFLVSFILIFLYERYNSIVCPIIMHISLNLTSVLMVNLIILNYTIFNLYLLIVSIFILIILKKKFINIV